MIVLVCGGRDYNDTVEGYRVLNQIQADHGIDLIIQGNAWGADLIGKKWASDNELPYLTVPAKWSKHGKAAGAIRNSKMLEYRPDLVVAFPGGRGTQNMMYQAREAGINVIDVEEDDV